MIVERTKIGVSVSNKCNSKYVELNVGELSLTSNTVMITIALPVLATGVPRSYAIIVKLYSSLVSLSKGLINKSSPFSGDK